jgi:hypothetical protein
MKAFEVCVQLFKHQLTDLGLASFLTGRIYAAPSMPYRT